MALRGLFYSEFDNIAGPQIVFQAPPNVLSNEAFDSVSGYIIIDKALCGKIITVCVQGLKIVGYPVCIEDDKYHRNALLFNIGFLFDEHMQTEAYRPILRKLGTLVENMERESGFLYNADRKAQLAAILPQILRDLTRHGECTIPVDEANVINLKLFPKLQDPAPVADYQVPVAIRDLRLLLETSAEWDLALQQIVPFIDGVKYVKRISLEADVELAIVKKCIRQLLYYGCVTMIDIFLHSNIYATTPRIAALAADAKLQAECAVYITKSGRHPPSFSKIIFALYCSMQPSLRMSDFCVVYAESLAAIDVRRFVTFGLIHGFLRRVHRYPIHSIAASPSLAQRTFVLTNSPSPAVLTPPPNAAAASSSSQSSGANGSNGNSNSGVLSSKASKRVSGGIVKNPNPMEKDVLAMMNGEHHTDDICSALLLRYGDVESLMQRMPSTCFVVHK